MDSQANKRMRTSKENLSRMENEFRNMKREMDELRNAIKDIMIRRTDSPFTIEVLNHPLPPKFCLP